MKMKLIPYFLSFWYPLLPTTKLYPFQPSKADIFSVPLVIYYKNKTDERWVIYSKNVEATKISSEWYLWMLKILIGAPSTVEALQSPPFFQEPQESFPVSHFVSPSLCGQAFPEPTLF